MDLLLLAQEATEEAELPQWVYVATGIAVVVGALVVVANTTISRRREATGRRNDRDPADPLG